MMTPASIGIRGDARLIVRKRAERRYPLYHTSAHFFLHIYHPTKSISIEQTKAYRAKEFLQKESIRSRRTEQKNIPIMTRRHFLPLPGALCLLLAATTLGGGASAAKYEYTNLHRDVYLDLIGQSSPFASEAALSTLKAALKSYGPTFVTKFSECVAEFTNGDTKVGTMTAPSWKVYSSARQY